MLGRSTTTLLGNLTKEIEQSTTKSGILVTKFTLAVNHAKDSVSFIDCVAWDQTAEFLSKYAKKGQTLYVEGQLKQNRFKDKDGNNRSKHEVTAFIVNILSKAGSDTDVTTNSDRLPTDEEVDKPINLEDIPFN